LFGSPSVVDTKLLCKIRTWILLDLQKVPEPVPDPTLNIHYFTILLIIIKSQGIFYDFLKGPRPVPDPDHNLKFRIRSGFTALVGSTTVMFTTGKKLYRTRMIKNEEEARRRRLRSLFSPCGRA
jgi:hypothetical protein